jgi:uncharacterized protein YbbC (DUF1343 family)
MIHRNFRFILGVILSLAGIRASAQPLVLPALPAVGQGAVRPGIEVLESRGFPGLAGKRVGLVTNPSGVDRQLRSTIDILFDAPEVNLVALYGPEHGVRGEVYAGGFVADGKDARTGLPTFSIYGKYRKPSPEMLKGIDVMVYDIQDVGSRSYTFISTLGLVMRACAEQGIEVMVLDRPNPLGGKKVEGCYVEPGFNSFVSEFRIPYVYGLTVGELAILINEEGLNRGEKGDEPPLSCKLTVIPMEGWTRDMTFRDTGLPWILPSPNIPSMQSAIAYPSAGIAGEFQNYLNIGVGYTIPFETFAAEWIDADALKARLDSYGIPGTAFRTIHYTPLFGSMSGKLIHGVQYFYTDYDAATVTLTQFWVMQAVNELYPEHNPFSELKRTRMFDIVCGTDYVRETFGKRLKVADIEAYWGKDAEVFRKLSRRYYLYR